MAVPRGWVLCPLGCPQWVRTHKVQRAKCQKGTPGCDCAALHGDGRQGSLRRCTRGGAGRSWPSPPAPPLPLCLPASPGPSLSRHSLIHNQHWNICLSVLLGIKQDRDSVEIPTIAFFKCFNSAPSPNSPKVEDLSSSSQRPGSPAGNCTRPVLG